MKKLVLLLVVVFVGAVSLYAQSIANLDFNSQREIPLEEQNPIEHGPIGRSVDILPAQAYLMNQVVSVTILEEISSATVSIINASNGEVVHSEKYSNPATISIDLSKVASGKYYIEIVLDDISLKGSFLF